MSGLYRGRIVPFKNPSGKSLLLVSRPSHSRRTQRGTAIFRTASEASAPVVCMPWTPLRSLHLPSVSGSAAASRSPGWLWATVEIGLDHRSARGGLRDNDLQGKLDGGNGLCGKLPAYAADYYGRIRDRGLDIRVCEVLR